MKPGLVADAKEGNQEEVKMEGPSVQVVHKTKAPWVLALMALLAIAVVTAGFLGAFYIMKTATEEHADQIEEFLMSSREQQEQIISYNIQMQQQAEMQQPPEPEETEQRETEQQQPVIYHDSRKGLTVVIDEAQGSCLLHPTDRDNLDEDLRNQYLSQHPDPDGPEDTNSTLGPHEDKMEDTNLLGPKIKEMCEGKAVFWLFPQKELEAGEEEEQEEGKAEDAEEDKPEESDEDKDEEDDEDTGEVLSRKKRSGYYRKRYYRKHHYRPRYYRKHYYHRPSYRKRCYGYYCKPHYGSYYRKHHYGSYYRKRYHRPYYRKRYYRKSYRKHRYSYHRKSYY